MTGGKRMVEEVRLPGPRDSRRAPRAAQVPGGHGTATYQSTAGAARVWAQRLEEIWVGYEYHSSKSARQKEVNTDGDNEGRSVHTLTHTHTQQTNKHRRTGTDRQGRTETECHKETGSRGGRGEVLRLAGNPVLQRRVAFVHVTVLVCQ